jgi:uncharacterized protein (TIRG00374 family)
MQKKILIALKLIISITLIVLVFKLCDIDVVKTWTKLRNTDVKWFIIGCLLLIGTTFTNNYRWLKLASLLGYKTSYFHGLKTYFESTFANNFLPTGFGGDALKAYDLGKADKTWLRAASTVIMERLFGFIFLFAQVPIGLVISKYTPLRDALPLKLELALWLAFLALVLSIISYPLWSKIPLGFIQKIRFSIHEYTRCHKSLIDVAAWTFITHVLFVAGNISMGLAMGAGIDRIPVWFWLVLVPASSLAGFIIPSVKGVGAKEASYIYMLGLIGINHDLGLAIAFQTFVATVIASLPGASIAFRRMKFLNPTKEMGEELKE